MMRILHLDFILALVRRLGQECVLNNVVIRVLDGLFEAKDAVAGDGGPALGCTGRRAHHQVCHVLPLPQARRGAPARAPLPASGRSSATP